LKEAGVVHRDIKPENIIYDPITKTLKIVDLGFATLCSNRIHLFPNCGTPGYAAPELLDKNNTVVSYYADVFSLGVTFYFLILEKLPYSE
jgi:serine/threonine protein kinase